jgi:hypothetical protein
MNNIPNYKLDQIQRNLKTNNHRWLLEELLVVLADSDSFSETAIDWVGKFAQASGARVTILVILPPIPLVFGRFLQYSIPGLFQSNDSLGKKVRWIADHFSDQGIKGTFKIREGEPEYQLRSEVFNSDPDVIFFKKELI